MAEQIDGRFDLGLVRVRLAVERFGLRFRGCPERLGIDDPLHGCRRTDDAVDRGPHGFAERMLEPVAARVGADHDDHLAAERDEAGVPLEPEIVTGRADERGHGDRQSPVRGVCRRGVRLSGGRSSANHRVQAVCKWRTCRQCNISTPRQTVLVLPGNPFCVPGAPAKARNRPVDGWALTDSSSGRLCEAIVTDVGLFWSSRRRVSRRYCVPFEEKKWNVCETRVDMGQLIVGHAARKTSRSPEA